MQYSPVLCLVIASWVFGIFTKAFNQWLYKFVTQVAHLLHVLGRGFLVDCQILELFVGMIFKLKIGSRKQQEQNLGLPWQSQTQKTASKTGSRSILVRCLWCIDGIIVGTGLGREKTFGSGWARARSPMTTVGSTPNVTTGASFCPESSYLSFILVPVGSCIWICVVVGGDIKHFA